MKRYEPPPYVPIFIITCNRLTVLKQSIASYHKHIKSNFEIVIHDNASTYPPLIAYLNDMEKSGIKVYRYQLRPENRTLGADSADEASVNVIIPRKVTNCEFRSQK